MFCPSCGARNTTGAEACAECGRALPVMRRPAGATLPDMPPADAARTVPDGPAPAPAQPPRILRKPAPLAPAPLDVVPRNEAALPSRAPAVSPEDPTVVRHKPYAPAPVAVAAPPPIQTNAELPSTRSLRPPPVSFPSAPGATPPGARDVSFGAGAGATAATPARRMPPPARPAPASDELPPIGAAVDVHAEETAPLPAARSVEAPTSSPSPPPALLRPAMAPAPPSSPVPQATPSPPPSPPPPAEPRMAQAPAAPVDTPAALAPAAAPVVVLTRGVPWLASSLVDVALGAAFAAGTVAGLLRGRGVRFAVQPVVDLVHASPVVAALLVAGGAFAGLVVYQALTVAVLRGTVGQRVFGLRVLRARTGAPAGPLRALVRAVACAVGSFALFAGPLFGLFVDRRRRGLGDVVAGTVVARRGEAP